MGFKKVGEAATPAPTPTPAATLPKPRIRAAKAADPAPAAEPAPEAEVAAPPPPPSRIMTAAQRAAQAAAAQQPAPDAAAQQVAESAAADEDIDSWTHSGSEAASLAAQEAQAREQAREERRSRGYWPFLFELIPPGTVSRNGPINDQYQKDIILLDARPGPCLFCHTMKNPRTGRFDVKEPCPKEFDSCCLCPPGGERESDYIMLLSVMNLAGYTYRTGEKMGQHVPITKELMVPYASDHAFFHKLMEEHGTLRGIQLTMTRSGKHEPRIGYPTYVGKFDDDQIEDFIKSNGLWMPKMTRPTAEHPQGEKIGDEDHLMQPFVYKDFVHKPSGADLRARYQNGSGAGAPIGARTNDAEWGNSRYQPGAQGGAGPGAATRHMDDLEDEVPF